MEKKLRTTKYRYFNNYLKNKILTFNLLNHRVKNINTVISYRMGKYINIKMLA